MNTINDRIQDVINVATSGNASKFARMCDVSASIINSIIGGRKSEPSFSVLSKIYTVALEYGVSAHWLLTGEGQMFYEEVVRDVANETGLSLYESNKLPSEYVDTLINNMKEEIKDLKEGIKYRENIIASREDFISGLMEQIDRLSGRAIED